MKEAWKVRFRKEQYDMTARIPYDYLKEIKEDSKPFLIRLFLKTLHK